MSAIIKRSSHVSIFKAGTRTVVRHGIQRRTRTPTVSLLGWNVRWPLALFSWLSCLNYRSFWQIGRDQVVNCKEGVPAEHAHIDDGIRDGCDEPRHYIVRVEMVVDSLSATLV